MTSRAQQLLVLRADAMLTPSVGVRLATIRPAAVGMSPTMESMTARDSSALNTRRAADVAGGVTYIAADVQLQNVKASAGANGTTVLHVDDDTRLYYKPILGAPPYQESVVGRTFTFSSAASGAQLISSSLDPTDGPAPTTDVAHASTAVVAASPSLAGYKTAAITRVAALPKLVAKVTPNVAAATASYNYSAMVSFEVAHWHNRTGEQYAFGNDCTNFASYALSDGGWAFTAVGSATDNKHWFLIWAPPRYPLTYSLSWSVASNWNQFARVHSGRVTALGNVWSTGIADIIQAKWAHESDMTHTMMVTKIDSANGHYMTYHTNDTLNRSLTDIINTNPGTTWYADRT